MMREYGLVFVFNGTIFESSKDIRSWRGYTSIFLLQALYDNKKEIDNYVELNRLGECKASNQPYCVEDKLNKLQDEICITLRRSYGA